MKNYDEQWSSSNLGTRARECTILLYATEPVEVEVSELDMRPWQKRETSEKHMSFKGCESRNLSAEIVIGDEFATNQLKLTDKKDREEFFYELNDDEKDISLAGIEIPWPECW